MTEGTLLYCDPFVFKNGATPKPKYFIVLEQDGFAQDGVKLAFRSRENLLGCLWK